MPLVKITTVAFQNSTKGLSIRSKLGIQKQGTNELTLSLKLFMKINLWAHKTLNQARSTTSPISRDTHLPIPSSTARKSKTSRNTHTRRRIPSFRTTGRLDRKTLRWSSITITTLCQVNCSERIQLTKTYCRRSFLHQCGPRWKELKSTKEIKYPISCHPNSSTLKSTYLKVISGGKLHMDRNAIH